MDDQQKSRAQLIEELDRLRRQVGTREIASPLNPDIEGLEKDLYISLIKHMPNFIVVIGPDGKTIRMNQFMLDCLGYELDEVKGKDYLSNFVPISDHVELKNVFSQLVNGHAETVNVNEILGKDGSRYLVEWYGCPVENEAGKVTHFFGIGIDITKRKEAEEALLENRRMLATLLGNLPGMAYRCLNDQHWTMQFVSEGCYSLTEYEPDELIGNREVTYNAIIHTNDREKVWHSVQDAVEKQTAFHMQYRIATKNGQEKWVWEKGCGIFDDQGELIALEGFITDITTERQAAAILKTEKERLDVTLRSIGDGMISTDTNGAILLMNEVAKRLTGWLGDSAMGKPLQEVLHLVNGKNHQAALDPVKEVLLAGERGINIERATLIAKDGSEKIIADSAAPIHNNENEIIGVVLIFRDITKQIKMEKELLRTEKLESIGTLAGGIAHDFNNVLTSVLGNISLAKVLSEKKSKIHDNLLESEKAILQARGLTQQLLTFAAGGMPIKTVTSLATLIKNTVDFVLDGTDIQTSFFLSDDLWAVDVDQAQMNQVITNLLINAKQAMPDGGVIEIAGENVQLKQRQDLPLPAGGYVKITVKDEGFGIPDEYQKKIFDPYFTTKNKGRGLGLSITHSILKKHGGLVRVESELGVGSSFQVFIPASSISEKPRDVSGDQDVAGRKKKILIMDDEKMIQEVAKNLLEYLGYEAHCAGDGEEAVQMYREAKKEGKQFDLVILDLTIPHGMDGKQTVKKLLEIDRHVKTIVSSGYSNDPVMSEYRHYGFMGVVCKPYQIEELEEVVKSVLGH